MKMPKPPKRLPKLGALTFASALIVASCGVDEAENATPTSTPTTDVPSSTTSSTTAPTTTTQVATPSTELPAPTEQAFNGRPVPQAPATADEAVAMFIAVQDGLRAEGSTQDDWADLGHTEQLIVRTLLRQPDWQEPFLGALPDDYARIGELHLLSLIHI